MVGILDGTPVGPSVALSVGSSVGGRVVGLLDGTPVGPSVGGTVLGINEERPVGKEVTKSF